jgi:hypothetical protein
MSNAVSPVSLIVVVAFDRGEDGELFPAFGPTGRQGDDRQSLST